MGLVVYIVGMSDGGREGREEGSVPAVGEEVDGCSFGSHLGAHL